VAATHKPLDFFAGKFHVCSFQIEARFRALGFGCDLTLWIEKFAPADRAGEADGRTAPKSPPTGLERAGQTDAAAAQTDSKRILNGKDRGFAPRKRI
jgi:hypothetical protein